MQLPLPEMGSGRVALVTIRQDRSESLISAMLTGWPFRYSKSPSAGHPPATDAKPLPVARESSRWTKMLWRRISRVNQAGNSDW